MPVTHGVAGSSPVQTAKKKKLGFEKRSYNIYTSEKEIWSGSSAG